MFRLLHGLHLVLQRRIGSGIAGGVGLVLLGSGIAIASIPDSSGVIHGCLQHSDWQLAGDRLAQCHVSAQ